MHYSLALLTKTEPNEKKIEQLMQPFHEYECTGVQDQYVTKVYDEQFHRDYEEDNRGCSSFREYLTDYCGVDVSGKWDGVEKGCYYDLTNPNAKWDWYEVGGRWEGMLHSKNNDSSNSMLISELDIEGQYRSILITQQSNYQDMLDSFEDGEKGEWRNYEECKDWDEYSNQPAIKQIRDKGLVKYYLNIDDMNCSLKEYLSKSPSPFLTYAVLVEGEEDNENMGWYEELTPHVWAFMLNEHKDYWITIIDIHN